METNKYLNPAKLKDLQKRIWEIASEHGWHDKKVSASQYLGLIMTEVAEAIEADRNGRYADMETFNKRMAFVDSCFLHCNTIHKLCFKYMYKRYIKGSIEEEFADVVIRLLDMAQDIHGSEIKWGGCYHDGMMYRKDRLFIENAWSFVREVVNCDKMYISDSVAFMFDWARDYYIDLWQHIELKMKYNDLRPYKHGGKKY